MSGTPRLCTPSEHKVVGPDYFGFYTREVAEFFSQDDDLLSLLPVNSNFGGKTSCVAGENFLTKNSHNSKMHKEITGSSPAPLFSNAIGAQLSDFRKERLRSLVRQSLFAFTQEVDEMLDPVLRICRIQSFLRYKRSTLSLPGASCESDGHHPQKKQKIDDLQVLLENDSTKVEEIMKKHSDDLLAMIEHMERKLEEFLDIVISQCRVMTLAEKQQLREMIQDLPSTNLERVVEIIQHSKQLDTYSCDEIYVDLETENKVVLWRLYYYVEAVENARKLARVGKPFQKAAEAIIGSLEEDIHYTAP